jgi:hypothetical protein
MSGRTILILAALVALAAKVVIAHNTYGTNDAITFEADIAKLEASGPQELYREGVESRPGHWQPFSHSPPLIHLLLLLKKLENRSGLPVRFWLRVCCALADLASLGLLWKIGVRSQAGLLLTALAPVSLMISGFHVNTDPLLMCVILASVCLIRSRHFAWAGVAVGIALSIKLSALIFVPALAIAAGAKRSAAMAGAALVCFCGFSLPYIWQFPGTILASVMKYAGLYKYWGIPAFSLLIGADGVYLWYERVGKFIALGAVGVAVVVVHKRAIREKGRPEDLLLSCGLSAALFLFFTPGFGVQYLVYLVPWLAISRGSVAASFHVTSGAWLAAFYTWGSGGFPWYLANTFSTRFMPVPVFSLGLLTWIATGIVALDFARSIQPLSPRPVYYCAGYGDIRGGLESGSTSQAVRSRK